VANRAVPWSLVGPDLPLTRRKPTHFRVSPDLDLFSGWADHDIVVDVFAMMASASTHTFEIVTGSADRMRETLTSTQFRRDVHARMGDPVAALWPLPNVWLGVPVLDGLHSPRVLDLLRTPAAIHFASCEPLLGFVQLDMIVLPGQEFDHGIFNAFTDRWSPLQEVCLDRRLDRIGVTGSRLDWVVAGGGSGRGAQPTHPDWLRSLRDQCRDAGVPFTFTGWGAWGPTGHTPHTEARTVGLTGTTPRGGSQRLRIDRSGQVRTTNDVTTFRIPPDWADMVRRTPAVTGDVLDGERHTARPQTH